MAIVKIAYRSTKSQTYGDKTHHFPQHFRATVVADSIERAIEIVTAKHGERPDFRITSAMMECYGVDTEVIVDDEYAATVRPVKD